MTEGKVVDTEAQDEADGKFVGSEGGADAAEGTVADCGSQARIQIGPTDV